MSHQTHYRSYRGRVFTGQMTQTTVSKQWSRPSLNLVKISPVQSVKCNTPMLKVKGSVSRSHSKCQLITDISVPYRKLESLNLMTTSEFWSEAGKWQCVCVCVCTCSTNWAKNIPQWLAQLERPSSCNASQLPSFLVIRPPNVSREGLKFYQRTFFTSFFIFYQTTVLSSHAVDSHQMYSGSSVIGKASTTGIEISPTTSVIFTGV